MNYLSDELLNEVHKLPFYYVERFDRFHAWYDLLLSASKDEETKIYNGETIHLTKGQIVIGKTILADRWRWNVRTVSKFLDFLSSNGLIETKSNNRWTLIKINHFQNQIGE